MLVGLIDSSWIFGWQASAEILNYAWTNVVSKANSESLNNKWRAKGWVRRSEARGISNSELYLLWYLCDILTMTTDHGILGMSSRASLCDICKLLSLCAPRSGRRSFFFCCLLAGNANWLDVVKPPSKPWSLWIRCCYDACWACGSHAMFFTCFSMSHRVFQKPTTKLCINLMVGIWNAISESFQFSRLCHRLQTVTNCYDLSLVYHFRTSHCGANPPEWTALLASLQTLPIMRSRPDTLICYKSWWKPSRTTNTASISLCKFPPATFQHAKTLENQVPSISFCRLAIRSSRVSTCANHKNRPDPSWPSPADHFSGSLAVHSSVSFARYLEIWNHEASMNRSILFHI